MLKKITILILLFITFLGAIYSTAQAGTFVHYGTAKDVAFTNRTYRIEIAAVVEYFPGTHRDKVHQIWFRGYDKTEPGRLTLFNLNNWRNGVFLVNKPTGSNSFQTINWWGGQVVMNKQAFDKGWYLVAQNINKTFNAYDTTGIRLETDVYYQGIVLSLYQGHASLSRYW